MNALRLYGRYVAVAVRAQMQYPLSFLLLVLGQFLATIIEFVGLVALFGRFDGLLGWTLPQVALFYAAVNIAFALADTISRGLDVFGPQYVKTGAFDRVLLRPRTALLQLMGHDLRLSRIGRLLQGLLVLAIALRLLNASWGAREVALLTGAICGGVALFLGLLVLQATLAFWTVESLEVANALTYGGVFAAQYPIEIYARWLRQFFVFVVPLGCVAYFPVVGILGIDDPLGAPRWLLHASPLAGFVFLAVALLIWRLGVRHYTSTGS
jgi:ABC-2 type transport system permease protein